MPWMHSRQVPSSRLVLLLGAFLLWPVTGAAATLTVFAGVEPVGALAEVVGGERVDVHVLVPAGQSPHTFEPTPRQLAGLESADIYFAVGMPFESAWVERLREAVPDLRVVHLERGEQGHDPVSGHGDPHPWTDPLSATALAGRIRAALVEVDPAGSEAFETGYRALSEALHEVHRDMEHVLSPVRGGAFLVYHPAWSALAERYGLKQLSVESEGKSPGARHLASVITEARNAGVCAVFVQPQFSDRAARRVAEELGVPVISMDPLSGNPAEFLPEVAHTLARYMDRPCPR